MTAPVPDGTGFRRALRLVVRLLLVIVLSAAVLWLVPRILLVSSFRGAAPSNGLVVVRNLSPGTVTIEITRPGTGLLPFLPSTATSPAPPWRPGRCYLRVGTDAGEIRVRVFGSLIRQPWSVATTVPKEARQEPITVEIAGDGRVTFGLVLPDEPRPCTSGGG